MFMDQKLRQKPLNQKTAPTRGERGKDDPSICLESERVTELPHARTQPVQGRRRRWVEEIQFPASSSIYPSHRVPRWVSLSHLLPCYCYCSSCPTVCHLLVLRPSHCCLMPMVMALMMVERSSLGRKTIRLWARNFFVWITTRFPGDSIGMFMLIVGRVKSLIN